MADNNYTVTTIFDLDKEVANGDTLVVLASTYPHTFSPVLGISALNIDSISISGNQTLPGFSIALSGAATLPYEITWDGVNATPEALWFYIIVDNTVAHVETLVTDVVVSVSSTGTSLFGGPSAASGTMINGIWTSSIDSLTAIGTKWHQWDSIEEHSRLYEQGQI